LIARVARKTTAWPEPQKRWFHRGARRMWGHVDFTAAPENGRHNGADPTTAKETQR
jgi:hypothetical protein